MNYVLRMDHWERNGVTIDGPGGYHIGDYAAAAGAEIRPYPTREEAQAAADAIYAAADWDGVRCSLRVEEA